jgi:hypothetical protein
MLGVERVFEGAVKGQGSYVRRVEGQLDPRWRSGRNPATPDRL